MSKPLTLFGTTVEWTVPGQLVTFTRRDGTVEQLIVAELPSSDELLALLTQTQPPPDS